MCKGDISWVYRVGYPDIKPVLILMSRVFCERPPGSTYDQEQDNNTILSQRFRASLKGLQKHNSEYANLNPSAAKDCLKREASTLTDELLCSNHHTTSAILVPLRYRYDCHTEPQNRKLCQWLDNALHYERKDHRIYKLFQIFCVIFREKGIVKRHPSRIRRQFGRNDLIQTFRNFCKPKLKKDLGKDLLIPSYLKRHNVTVNEGMVQFNVILTTMCCFLQGI